MATTAQEAFKQWRQSYLAKTEGHETWPFSDDCLARVVVAGSQAYGMATEESDYDFAGFTMPPKHVWASHQNAYEQTIHGCQVKLERLSNGVLAPFETKGEGTIYGLRKFVHLACQANPNIIEQLWVDPSGVVFESAVGKVIAEARHLFMSRKIRWTFSGYAMAQMKKIRLHRNHLLSPPDHKPTRTEFGLPDRPDETMSRVRAAIKKKIDSWALDLDGLEKDRRLSIQDSLDRHLTDIANWVDWHEAYSRAEAETLAAGLALGLPEFYLERIKGEVKYETAIHSWNKYKEWEKNRNPQRAVLESKYGFDCYSADTEFLTEQGWKVYDDIPTGTKLATVHISGKRAHVPWGSVEFQIPEERFDGTYTGNMYAVSGTHTNIRVTANHRCFIQEHQRNTKVDLAWTLTEAAQLPDSFNILIAPTPKQRQFKKSDRLRSFGFSSREFIRLIGWYLSDGVMVFSAKGEPEALRISQVKEGALLREARLFARKHPSRVKSYEYPRVIDGRSCVENVFIIHNMKMAAFVRETCGDTDTKRVPRWAFDLSAPDMNLLLNSLIDGDGTRRIHRTKEDSFIYYSTLKPLADTVQELGVLTGWETALWGPFWTESNYGGCWMYQVHLRPLSSRTKNLVRGKNIQKEAVTNERIVCFSVENGVLITRREGNVAIQGNCKHGAHVVRLCRQGLETLKTGIMQTRRPDAEELLAIRRGAWTFEQLEDFVSKTDVEYAKAEAESPLPKTADHAGIERLMTGLVFGNTC